MLAFSALTVTFAKRRTFFFCLFVFLKAYCNVMQKLDTIHSTEGLFTNKPDGERDHFHFKSQPFSHQHWDSISSCQSLAASAPSVSPIAVYKFTSLLLPVWLMLVIMALLLFTQHIYPSLLSAICWLTSSTFYWLSLMGQLKGVLTFLWNVTALSLLFICEIGVWKGIFQGYYF